MEGLRGRGDLTDFINETVPRPSQSYSWDTVIQLLYFYKIIQSEISKIRRAESNLYQNVLEKYMARNLNIKVLPD